MTSRSKTTSKTTLAGILLGLLALLAFFVSQARAFQAELELETPRVFLPIVSRSLLPTSPPTDDNWFSYLNYYRALAYLPPISENTDWSDGNWHHARYSVKNDQLQHSESPGNPWYTPAGHQAAQSSNLFGSFNTSENDSTAITWWISGPFHAVGILNPQLLETGYGSYREADGGLTMAAGLDIIRGVGGMHPAVNFPIRWPGDGAIVYLTQHAGEIPDPLTSCPGYSHPAGLPIMIQLGAGNITPHIQSTRILQDGVPIEHCTFDETNYNNPNSGYQSLGRGLLNGRDAVVMIPRYRLNPGSLYTVSVTNSGTTHTWSFRVDEGATGLSNTQIISN